MQSLAHVCATPHTVAGYCYFYSGLNTQLLTVGLVKRMHWLMTIHELIIMKQKLITRTKNALSNDNMTHANSKFAINDVK